MHSSRKLGPFESREVVPRGGGVRVSGAVNLGHHSCQGQLELTAASLPRNHIKQGWVCSPGAPHPWLMVPVLPARFSLGKLRRASLGSASVPHGPATGSALLPASISSLKVSQESSPVHPPKLVWLSQHLAQRVICHGFKSGP